MQVILLNIHAFIRILLLISLCYKEYVFKCYKINLANNPAPHSSETNKSTKILRHYSPSASMGAVYFSPANCEHLPPRGAYGFFLPIKTQGGTEALMRAVGLIPA